MGGRKVCYEIGDSEDRVGMNEWIAESVRAVLSRHPLGNCDPARLRFDHERRRRAGDHTNAPKTSSGQGVETVEDGDGTGTGLVSYVCTSRVDRQRLPGTVRSKSARTGRMPGTARSESG